MHEMIQQLATAVSAMEPTRDVEIGGAWSGSTRKTYKDASQQGSGVGPFVEVVDARWRATLKCPVPVVGFAFMDTPVQTFWVKSIGPAVNPEVEVSLHAYAGSLPGRASFAGRLFESVVPAVPVACGENAADSCILGPARTTTGAAHIIAQVSDTAFIILVLPKSVAKVGRNRLWHFRTQFAPVLDGELRVFDRRTGILRRADSGKCDAG